MFVSPPLECKLLVEIVLFYTDFASTQFKREFFLVYLQGTRDNLKARPLKEIY